MPCVFCGSSDTITKEHLFSEWLRTLLREMAPGWGFQVAFREEGGPIVLHRRSTYRTHQWRRIVCQKCNNGWMSRLEGQHGGVRPVLEPLVRGKPITLSRADQELLMRWIVKTAVVWEYTEPESASMSFESRKRFATTLQPPGATQIWLGSFDMGVPPRVTAFEYWHLAYAVEHSDPIPPTDPPNAQWTAFTIDQLAMQIFIGDWHASLGGLDPRFDSRIGPKLRQLWPIVGDLTLPFGPPMTMADLEHLMGPIPRP